MFAPYLCLETDWPQTDIIISFALFFTLYKELFLKPEDVEKLHDFEEECVEDYWRQKQRDERKQSELQLDNISSRWVVNQPPYLFFPQ